MTDWLLATLEEFRRARRLADSAMTQVDDAGFFGAPDPATNSIAIIVKHMGGNLRSRWTDFLTTDGEKPDRDRDSEFELTSADTRADLLARWDRGWQLVLDAISALTEDDLRRTVTVRGESLTVPHAIQRQLAHASYHTGQIALLARHYAGADWTSLTIPKGGSAAYNAQAAAVR